MVPSIGGRQPALARYYVEQDGSDSLIGPLCSGADISPPLRGFISLSTPPRYRQDAVPAARALKIPVLYLASRDEGLTAETQALYEATGSADKTMHIVTGSAHGFDLLDPMLGKPSWRIVRGLIETFLRTH